MSNNDLQPRQSHSVGAGDQTLTPRQTKSKSRILKALRKISSRMRKRRIRNLEELVENRRREQNFENQNNKTSDQQFPSVNDIVGETQEGFPERSRKPIVADDRLKVSLAIRSPNISDFQSYLTNVREEATAQEDGERIATEQRGIEEATKEVFRCKFGQHKGKFGVFTDERDNTGDSKSSEAEPAAERTPRKFGNVFNFELDRRRLTPTAASSEENTDVDFQPTVQDHENLENNLDELSETSMAPLTRDTRELDELSNTLASKTMSKAENDASSESERDLNSNASSAQPGVYLEPKDGSLNVTFRIPMTGNTLVSPSHRNQGEVHYRLKSTFARHHKAHNAGPSGNFSRIAGTNSPVSASDQRRTEPVANTESASNGNGQSASSTSESADTNETPRTGSIGDIVDSILNPPDAPNPLILDGPAIDNVAWHDYSEYQYFLSPSYLQPTVAPLAGTTAAMSPELFSLAADLEEKGVQSDDLIEFLNHFVTTLIEILYRSTDHIERNAGHQMRFLASNVVQRVVDALRQEPELLADLAEEFWNLTVPQRLHMDDNLVSRAREAYLQLLAYSFPPFLRLPVEPIEVPTLRYWPQQIEFFESIISDFIHPEEIRLRLKFARGAANRYLQRDDAFNQSLFDRNTNTTPNGRPSGRQEYPFDLYLPGTVNLGIRFLYRQEWQPLGHQAGEIVRTVPLAPTEVQRISTKVIRRRKVSHSSENLTSAELSEESIDTTKDSSEVVREAATSNKWHAEASGSTNFGFGSASFSGGVEETKERKSRNTSNSLSEAVQKSASKIRTETKVVVNTESEQEFENLASSEISNPNNEIALTYVYSRLQTQYNVFTALSEVKNVVMVAEAVPAPDDISVEWIRRYSWIIARVLLDDSFREVLASLHQEVDSPHDGGLISDLQMTRDKAIEHLGSIASNPSGLNLQQIDVVVQSQESFVEAVRAEKDRIHRRNQISVQRARLVNHIRDNILHYCRAIWQQEDADQRILRYRRQKLRVPTTFEFVVQDGTAISLSEFFDALRHDSQNSSATNLEGTFAQIDDSEDEVFVADIIDRSGPLGFLGNYAVFELKHDALPTDVPLLFDIFKADYLPDEKSPDTEYAEGILVDPLLKDIRRKLERNEIEGFGSGDDGDRVFDENSRTEMIELVPKLRAAAAIRLANDENSSIMGMDTDLFRQCEAEAVHRRLMSRRVAVETNNLMVDILPGSGSALERFKLAHRGIDVLKADEERRRLELDNDRRQHLVDSETYSYVDPEHLTVITGVPSDSPLLSARFWQNPADSNESLPIGNPRGARPSQED